MSFSCFNGNVCLYFFVKKYSKLVQMRAEEKLVYTMPSAAEFRKAKNSGCRLAGRHLLCSQVASDILRSLRGLPLAVCRKCLGRQRLASLKHVSGFPAHCSTCSLRLRNAAICFTKLLALAVKYQASLYFARLIATFAFSDELLLLLLTKAGVIS